MNKPEQLLFFSSETRWFPLRRIFNFPIQIADELSSRLRDVIVLFRCGSFFPLAASESVVPKAVGADYSVWDLLRCQTFPLNAGLNRRRRRANYNIEIFCGNRFPIVEFLEKRRHTRWRNIVRISAASCATRSFLPIFRVSTKSTVAP